MADQTAPGAEQPPEQSATEGQTPDAGTPPEGEEGQAQPAGEGQPKPEEGERRQQSSRIQQRIDQLTRERHEAERRAEMAWVQLEQQRIERESVASIQQVDSQEPRLDQFQSLEDFQRTHARWASNRAMAMFRAEQQRVGFENAQREQAAVREQQAAMGQISHERQFVAERIPEAVKKYPDFEKVVNNPSLPVALGTPLMDAVMRSDNPIDIAYALGKNPEQYVRLLQMGNANPAVMMWEVAKLDAKFSTAPKTSAAPPPPPELGGHSTALDALAGAKTDEDWIKAREADLRKRKVRI